MLRLDEVEGEGDGSQGFERSLSTTSSTTSVEAVTASRQLIPLRERCENSS